ncbi:hypothetical protein BCR42DRAFT_426610 [Absidia repens]|uniref:Uncharacterized protein n=1 Tax=Absidia repens TaxID=90262 RepID=A0A1X2I0R0_9FUNG|nr:hypothetical protein BCR42DRAFT_426610 [Absidia repens]
MPLITKSSSSSTTSTCSSSSTTSTSTLRMFLNQMLDSILHPFSPPVPSPSRSQDLLNVEHDMNANLSIFEKTYVSFPELVDQDGACVRHTAQPHHSSAY